MTLEELEQLLQETNWFKHLSEPFVASDQFVQISSLGPWTNLAQGDNELTELADKMAWLPSSKDDDDPIHGRSLEERSKQLGKKEEFFRKSFGIYKKALASLRNFEGHPALKIGPHDFTEAARGAALFACRCAAYEILLADCGFWCSIMKVYKQGHWPCGILPNSLVVIL